MRVTGGDFGAAMGRPRRDRSGQQRHSRGLSGSQCAWLAKPRPPARARVVGEGAPIWSTTRVPGRQGAATDLTGRANGALARAATSWPCERALGAERGALVAVPGPTGPPSSQKRSSCSWDRHRTRRVEPQSSLRVFSPGLFASKEDGRTDSRYQRSRGPPERVRGARRIAREGRTY